MDELKQRLLEKLKKLKGINDNKSDDVFLFALETAIYDVLNYCHFAVEEWPEALDNTTILMTVDLINETSYSFNATEAEAEVKSLSEGDFSITKETAAEAYQKMMSIPSFSRHYKRNLNSYRKLG
ncbi:hypothetical protein QLI93_001602 [Listeria monocytogenes]|uniref:hypothetical protein n=1 Tax=Listeria monocytogenes TaxID=1639 RepID=UPI000F16EBAC|nr:hypothetical protein [Listeria monocytogenes]EAC8001186.1 hypothetical protein [Listeria monocytogenes]EJC6460067.1 hypothetical protein [Listeria monocytogenes]EJT8453811.1 hypothetical protein [Listeria monocytogenes]EKZ7015245.1 hypothetical protein [Listeria monocytogenes]MCM64449.1 hypothetical protein [Listeria monocytogenes]